MTTTLETERLQQIPIDLIAECTHNPRRHFDAERLAELSASVLEHGVLTPLLVRARGKALFELAAGHRRLRAAKAAGLKTVPAIVREMDDRQFAEVLCIENLQRQNLDELDEAEGFRQLRELAGYDVPTIALKLSRSEKYVYDRLKLLDLVPTAQDLLRRGLINAGHGILLARLSPADQERAIDPVQGGAFEEEAPDSNGLFDDDRDVSAAPIDGSVQQRWEGKKAATVRELEAWINAHVRLDREVLDPVYDSAAHNLFAAQASEEALKVVPITRLGVVPPMARADERTLCVTSWKRADGAHEHDWRGRETVTKTCEHAVKGVVVVGPGRGEVFDICTAKKACKVHWKDEQKRSAHYIGNPVTNRRAEADAQHQKEQSEQRRSAQEKVMPVLEALVRDRVGKMELDSTSKPVAESFRDFGDSLDISAADCDALLKRSKDGFRAIVELRALGLAREAATAYGDPGHELRHLDALLGGGQFSKAYADALKGVQTSALAAKRAEAKAAKAAAKGAGGANPKVKAKGKAKRAGRSRSALPLVLALAGALVLLALGGCNGPGWARVASTLEVGAGNTDHRADDSLGNPIYADSTQVWVTVRPLAFMEPPTQVVIVKGKGE